MDMTLIINATNLNQIYFICHVELKSYFFKKEVIPFLLKKCTILVGQSVKRIGHSTTFDLILCDSEMT